MSKMQMLRASVTQRLTAAAEEIFVLFERSIAEYEEELSRSKEEYERQRKLLDVFVMPEVRLHRADVQQLLESKEEVPPEQQERSSSLDQEDQEPPHINPTHFIKEEQEELLTSQEAEQLQVLEEADIKFTFTPVPVKSEDDEEKPQCSQIHQNQIEKNREAEHLNTDAGGEDCGRSEAAENSDPDRHLQPVCHYDSFQLHKHVAEQSDNEKSNDLKCNTGKKSFSCSECGKKFVRKDNMKSHMRCHTEEKSFGCLICGKIFRKNANLARHVKIHAAEKPYTCSVCNSGFIQRGTLGQHMRIHTGEKPFSCSICGKRFTQKGSVTEHMTIHTGEKPFSCSICGKGLNRRSHIKRHKCVHFTNAYVVKRK